MMYGILLYDGVEPIDIGATFGVLSMASRIAGDLEFAGVAQKSGDILCAGGLKVSARYSFADAPEFSDLIVTGGPGWQAASRDAETLNYIASSSARVSAICTGAMILSAAGALDGKKAATKHQVFEGEVPPSKILAEKTETRSAAVVDDGGTVTSGGVTLGIDAMFYCLARSHGEHVARETARVMEYSRALAANKSVLGYV